MPPVFGSSATGAGTGSTAAEDSHASQPGGGTSGGGTAAQDATALPSTPAKGVGGNSFSGASSTEAATGRAADSTCPAQCSVPGRQAPAAGLVAGTGAGRAVDPGRSGSSTGKADHPSADAATKGVPHSGSGPTQPGPGTMLATDRHGSAVRERSGRTGPGTTS